MLYYNDANELKKSARIGVASQVFSSVTYKCKIVYSKIDNLKLTLKHFA